MNRKIIINGRVISDTSEPYIIAEMSANHNGDIENAYKIIFEAKKAGADAIKIQTYTADTLTVDSKLPDFMIEEGLWKGQSLYDLYKSAYTPWEWHKPMFDYAKSQKITMFSSPFDKTAVDLLEDLNAPAYKIASFEAIDLELIKYVASTLKPMIISTGMANFEEIQEAIETAYEGGCKQLAILHCVSGYPAPPDNYNIKTIRDMIKKFDLITGLSDHTLDNTTAIASISLGARIIEKHFTIDRTRGGPDDSFSMEPSDLVDLIKCSKTATKALGRVTYKLKSSEKENIKFRRSLYFIKNIKAGTSITKECIRSIRPGYGLKPKYLNKILGKKTKQNIKANTPVSFDMIE